MFGDNNLFGCLPVGSVVGNSSNQMAQSLNEYYFQMQHSILFGAGVVRQNFAENNAILYKSNALNKIARNKKLLLLET